MIGTSFVEFLERRIGPIELGASRARVSTANTQRPQWALDNMATVLVWLEGECVRRGIEWSPDNAIRLVRVFVRWYIRRYGSSPTPVVKILDTPRRVPKLPAPVERHFGWGIGSQIKSICHRVGLASCVTCDGKAKAWDEAGLPWCESRKAEMREWLVTQARKRKINYANVAATIAACEPSIAASVAFQSLMHPLSDLVELAAGCVVEHAIGRYKARKARPIIPIHERVPVVITACPRPAEFHRQTMDSVRAAGFSEVYVSCEPGTNLDSFAGAEIRPNTEKLGQWRNLIRTLEIGLETDANHFVSMEDDVILCRQSRDLIIESGWPDGKCGVVQLYSAARYGAKGIYPRGVRSPLTAENAFDMLGCCALLWSRDAARLCVEWAKTKGWRGDVQDTVDEPSEKKAGDTFVGEVLTVHNFGIWIYNPSIADHIGVESSLGHRGGEPASRRALRFPGVDADLRAIFREELA